MFPLYGDGGEHFGEWGNFLESTRMSSLKTKCTHGCFNKSNKKNIYIIPIRNNIISLGHSQSEALPGGREQDQTRRGYYRSVFYGSKTLWRELCQGVGREGHAQADNRFVPRHQMALYWTFATQQHKPDHKSPGPVHGRDCRQ